MLIERLLAKKDILAAICPRDSHTVIVIVLIGCAAWYHNRLERSKRKEKTMMKERTTIDYCICSLLFLSGLPAGNYHWPKIVRHPYAGGEDCCRMRRWDSVTHVKGTGGRLDVSCTSVKWCRGN